MPELRTIHEWFSWVVIVANGLVGAWALGAHRFGGLRRDLMWWAAGTAHATVGVQLVIGVVLVASQGFEVDQFHMFYGFLALVGVGLIVSYRHLSEYRYLVYGLGGLFVMGLAIRAAVLNPTP